MAAEKERKKENKATMMKSEERKENIKKRVTGEFFFSSFLAFGGQHLTAKFFADSFFLRKMTMRENFEFCVFCPLSFEIFSRLSFEEECDESAFSSYYTNINTAVQNTYSRAYTLIIRTAYNNAT